MQMDKENHKNERKANAREKPNVLRCEWLTEKNQYFTSSRFRNIELFDAKHRTLWLTMYRKN